MADEDQAVVTVYETESLLEIGMVKSAFGEADIPFMAINDIVSSVYPVDGMAIVKFQVLGRDVPRARQVLSDLGLG